MCLRHRARFGLANPPAKGLDTPRRGVPAHLAARLCALYRKQGGQELVPFEHPRGVEQERGPVASLSKASCPRLQAPAAGLIDRPAQTGEDGYSGEKPAVSVRTFALALRARCSKTSGGQAFVVVPPDRSLHPKGARTEAFGRLVQPGG